MWGSTATGASVQEGGVPPIFGLFAPRVGLATLVGLATPIGLATPVGLETMLVLRLPCWS